MHKEILSETQSKLLSIVKLFSKQFGLVGGTAMKAFALGRRAKWKDYVDLYFILKSGHTVSEIAIKGVEIFGNEFNEKIFRAQLAYFEDIDYSEQIIYTKGFSTDDQIIKKTLIEFSLDK